MTIEIMSVVLVVLIVLEITTAIIWISKHIKNQSKDDGMIETSKMIKKILLNNKWENIDDMIGMLINDSVHIDYKLKDEKRDI